MKDGTTHHGYEVDHKPGFIQVFSWDGETRYPTGDVEKIYSSKSERAINIFMPIMLGVNTILLVLIIEYYF